MKRMDVKAAGGMDAASYRALMRHQAGAVTVIASGNPGARSGLTATAVSSLSDAPPTILACVQQRSRTHDIITRHGIFSVNILSAGQQQVAQAFAGQTGLAGEDRFEPNQWETFHTGAPVLCGALSSLDCSLIESHAFTTHSIFIGRVEAGRFNADAAPLLYFRGDFWDLEDR